MRFFVYNTWCAVVPWIDLKRYLFVNKCFIRYEVIVTDLCDDFQYDRLGNVCCLSLVSVGWCEDEATASRHSKTAGVWWCGNAPIFVQQALYLPSRVTPAPQRKELAVYFFWRGCGHTIFLNQWTADAGRVVCNMSSDFWKFEIVLQFVKRAQEM